MGVSLARSLPIVVFAGLFEFISMAQTPQGMTPPAWLDHWRLSTFSFGRISRDQNNRSFYEVIGTGFLVALDEHTAYVVSAKHVFFDPDQNWHPSELRIRFAWQEHRSVYEEFGIPIRLRDDSGRDLWAHLNDGSDIAAIAPPADLGTRSLHAISVKSFATEDDLYEGAQVLVLGFPGVVGNEYLVRAISRAGIVAWTSPDGPLEKNFLVDSNVLPGNSGGPILRVPTGVNKYGVLEIGKKVALLGLISGGPVQDSLLVLQVPGVSEPIRLHTRVVGVGGVGIGEPASKILMLLRSLNQSGSHPE